MKFSHFLFALASTAGLASAAPSPPPQHGGLQARGIQPAKPASKPKTIYIEAGEMEQGTATDNMYTHGLNGMSSLFIINTNGRRVGAYLMGGQLTQAREAAKWAKKLGKPEKVLIDTTLTNAGDDIANAVFGALGVKRVDKENVEIKRYNSGRGKCFDFRLAPRMKSTKRQGCAFD